jgi:anti-sigma-K factor RskA
VNIQEYISSGIVESYVLGLASAEERIEFEQLCNQYPELIGARKKFEESIEKQAMENSPAPPDFLKEKIWSAIQKETKVVTMEPTRMKAGLRWVAAASIILFLAAGYFAFSFYNQNKKLEDQLKTAEEKQENMAKQLEMLLAQDKMMNDSNYMVVSMKSMKGDPSSASVFWDSTSTKVYMVVRNMPKLATNKQYQLWALIDNATKPISLGQFDGGEMMMLKMDGVKKADAFAITIEEKGNAGGPNLKELQSMTKLQ